MNIRRWHYEKNKRKYYLLRILQFSFKNRNFIIYNCDEAKYVNLYRSHSII